jgi:hypothetical protein
MRGSSTFAIQLILVFIVLLLITTVISDNVINHETAKSETEKLGAPKATTKSPVPLWAGFVGCLVASVFFGSNLLPVKQFSAGDGIFFQFVFCIAVWLVGLILDLILDNQRFYPLVLIGGM